MIFIDKVSKYYPVLSNYKDALSYLKLILSGQEEQCKEKVPCISALNNISFSVGRGERVGIVGRNGAGKTTLLKLIAGRFSPSQGSINIRGSLFSLIDETINFEPELSASSNIINYLKCYNFSDKEIKKKLDDIKEFVELEDYFYQPIQHYSLGMRLRVEFATATTVDADILIIDELLGAGDLYWVEKCASRIEEICSKGKTLLLVSHSMEHVLRYCERVIWVENGKIVMDDTTNEVVRRYEGYLETLSWRIEDVDDQTVDISEIYPGLGESVLPESNNKVVRWPGKRDVEYSGIWINDNASKSQAVMRENSINIKFKLKANESNVYELRYLVTLWSERGKRVGILENQVDIVDFHQNDERTVTTSIPANILRPQKYIISFALFDVSNSISSADEINTRLDLIYKSFHLEVKDDCSYNDSKLNSYFTVPFEFNPPL